MKRKKKNKISHTSFLLTALFLIGIGLVVASSVFSGSGFQAKNTEKHIESLLDENENLQLQITNLQSLKKLRESGSLESTLVPVDNLKHLKNTRFPNYQTSQAEASSN